MNVASLELSKELYDLSGWDETTFSWIPKNFFGHSGGTYGVTDGDFQLATGFYEDVATGEEVAMQPAYDLGYLLTKLPYGFTIVTRFNDGWMASWAEAAQAPDFAVEGDTPEDAVVLLTLELFRRGVMTDNPSTEQQAQ